MTHHKSRFMFANSLLILHLSSLLPLASSIGNAESPEYIAQELANGTILVFEPNSTNYMNVSQASFNSTDTTTTGQEQTPFVYTEAGLESVPVTSTNQTTTSQNETFDFAGAQWGDEYNAQSGNNNDKNNGNKWNNNKSGNKNNGNGNKNNNNNNKKRNPTKSDGYSFGQEGYLVQEDSTVDSEPGSWNYEQQGYPVREEPAVDSEPGNGNSDKKNATASDYTFDQQGYLEQEDLTIDSDPVPETEQEYTFQQAGYLVKEGEVADSESGSDGDNSAPEDGPGADIAEALMKYLGNQVDKAQGGGNRRFLRGA